MSRLSVFMKREEMEGKEEPLLLQQPKELLLKQQRGKEIEELSEKENKLSTEKR